MACNLSTRLNPGAWLVTIRTPAFPANRGPCVACGELGESREQNNRTLDPWRRQQGTSVQGCVWDPGGSGEHQSSTCALLRRRIIGQAPRDRAEAGQGREPRPPPPPTQHAPLTACWRAIRHKTTASMAAAAPSNVSPRPFGCHGRSVRHSEAGRDRTCRPPRCFGVPLAPTATLASALFHVPCACVVACAAAKRPAEAADLIYCDY